LTDMLLSGSVLHSSCPARFQPAWTCHCDASRTLILQF
jgi:hypothetical protein